MINTFTSARAAKFEPNGTPLSGVGRCVDAHTARHCVCNARARRPEFRPRPGRPARPNHYLPRLRQAFQDSSSRAPAPSSNGEIVQMLQGPAPANPECLVRRRRARGRTGGGPQSRRPSARYDGLRHRLCRSTQSAPDGPGRPARAGGLAGGLRPGRPRARRPPGRPGRPGRCHAGKNTVIYIHIHEYTCIYI